jgi:hypothetical protein
MSPTNSRSSSQERTAVPSSLPGLNLQQEIAASLANSKEKADAEAAAAAAATAAIPQGSGASQTVPPRSGTLGVVDNDKNTKDKGKGKEEDVSFGAAELRRMLLENGFDPLTIAKQLEELSATPSQEETESLRLSRNPSFSHHSSEDGEASPLQRYSKTSRYVHYDDEEDRGRSPGRRPPSPRSESLPQFTTPRRHRPRSRSISPDVGTIVRDRERQHREEEARRTAKEAESRRRREEKEGKIASNSRETTKPTESNNAPTSGTVPPSTTGTVNVEELSLASLSRRSTVVKTTTYLSSTPGRGTSRLTVVRSVSIRILSLLGGRSSIHSKEMLSVGLKLKLTRTLTSSTRPPTSTPTSLRARGLSKESTKSFVAISSIRPLTAPLSLTSRSSSKGKAPSVSLLRKYSA